MVKVPHEELAREFQNNPLSLADAANGPILLNTNKEP
jgi:hypothetical protein